MLPFMKKRAYLTLPFIAGLALANISWTSEVIHTSALNNWYDTPASDTVPGRQGEKKGTITWSGAATLDDHIRNIEQAGKDLDREMDKDWGKIEADIQRSLASIDDKELEQQIQKAMEETEKAMASLQLDQKKMQEDLAKMQEEIQRAMEDLKKEGRSANWEKEMEKAVESARIAAKNAARINEDEIRKALSKAKEDMAKNKANLSVHLESARKEISGNKLKIKESLQEAKKSLESAKKELEGYKTMIADMEKNGLIDTKKDYTIEYKSGNLSINGKEQPNTITEKYRKYFKHNATRLEKTEGKFEIESNQ
ncbi:hypothetical protein KJS94_18160 [Flavihumibacter rivuli]|uniref:hypothetical protein n=1 Tax=Flavihumibacter rivuli TaxID=2838156 RepID=UPI001BDE1188|nr:hypothetical protein [Flavihumibacter rivuli]ULQ56580.1 hypothetical protein KJS94_18160 [Flavihumibacter rivuli]